MKKSLMLISAFFSLSIVSMSCAQTSIENARTYAVGATVTINGVASDGGELGTSIRYIQDVTGGLPVYGFGQVSGVSRGDSVTVTGQLKDFSGLLEIDPISNLVNHGPGTEIPAWNINITNLEETYEGRLVRVDNVTFNDAGSTFANNTNYNFTDGTNSSEVRINGGTQLSGVTIPSGAQTIVGLLSEHNGTFQLLPRDADDIFPYQAPAKKIEVVMNGMTLPNGATMEIGTLASSSLEIKNIGINQLTVSSISFSGVNAADFSTTINPGAINGLDSETGAVDFSTTESGSRYADLVIESDDPDNPVFTIHIAAVGVDGLATEPTAGPTDLVFSNVKAYKMNVDFTSSPDAQGYLVLWQQGSVPTDAPVDGVHYRRGDMIGNAKVAYRGPFSSFSPRGIRADIDYHFAVYAYKGYDVYTNYNQTDVLTGNQVSGGEEIANYYNGITSEDTDLVDKLTALINPHTPSSYFMYKGLMMDNFEVMDTINGDSYVVCCYSAERKVFSGPFDWTATGYSREHTYPHSWYPTFPANDVYGQEEVEYIDYHNLYPINQSKANEPRGNLPLGEVVDVIYEYLEGKRGRDANNVIVYEPTDDNKGNAARSKFYMATAYNGIHGTGDDWSLPIHQNQDVLKAWHFQDLPDSYEIARNELIYSIQGNRNPYVDSVDFACYVDFHGMTYNTNGCEGLSLTTEYIENNLSVFPNPANTKVYIQLNGVEISTVEVRDITGREVGVYTTSYQYLELDVSNYKAGTYFLNINTEQGSIVRKVVVQ